jgi:putative FmdB family regulatory protein
VPIYSYTCTTCNQEVEKRQSFTDPPLTTCEHCGGTLRKIIHPVGIVFKGSGWYSTDSRAASSTSPSPSASSANAKDGEAKNGGSKDSGESKDASSKDGSAARESSASKDAASKAGGSKEASPAPSTAGAIASSAGSGSDKK